MIHGLSRATQPDALGVKSWRIARLFELELVPEPPGFSNRRVIPMAMIPAIVDVLQERGWLTVRDVQPG